MVAEPCSKLGTFLTVHGQMFDGTGSIQIKRGNHPISIIKYVFWWWRMVQLLVCNHEVIDEKLAVKKKIPREF